MISEGRAPAHLDAQLRFYALARAPPKKRQRRLRSVGVHKPLAPGIGVALCARWTISGAVTSTRTQICAQAQHSRAEMIGTTAVVAAAGRALASHHTALIDAARALLAAARALAHAAKAARVGSAPLIAKPRGHHEHDHHRANCHPSRHAYCLQARVGGARTATYIIRRDTSVKCRLEKRVITRGRAGASARRPRRSAARAWRRARRDLCRRAKRPSLRRS